MRHSLDFIVNRSHSLDFIVENELFFYFIGERDSLDFIVERNTLFILLERWYYLYFIVERVFSLFYWKKVIFPFCRERHNLYFSILLQRQIDNDILFMLLSRQRFSSFYSRGSLKKKNLKTVEREFFS